VFDLFLTMFNTIEIEKNISLHKASAKLLCIVAVLERKDDDIRLVHDRNCEHFAHRRKTLLCFISSTHFRGGYKIAHNNIIVPRDSHTLLSQLYSNNVSQKRRSWEESRRP
jgi:hypothetical protein